MGALTADRDTLKARVLELESQAANTFKRLQAYWGEGCKSIDAAIEHSIKMFENAMDGKERCAADAIRAEDDRDALKARVEAAEAELAAKKRDRTTRAYNCPQCGYHMTTNDEARMLESDRDEWKRRAEEAEASCAAMREALDAWARMPDAGFTSSDPRWAWWYETAGLRLKALAADAGKALLARLEAADELAKAAHKLDEDGTPTGDWIAVMRALAAYEKVKEGGA